MLKGDLITTPIEIALGTLADEAATGCLHVVDDDGSEALVYLRAGLVYAVSVPGQRPQLGARLISSNALVPENLAEALEAQRTELQGWRLGELLVHLGFVEQDVVEDFVQEQVRDGLTDLLAWTSGRWRFRKAEKTREDVAPPTPLNELLDEVRVRKSTWEEIVDAVHGPNAVPMLAAHGGEANVTLDPDTWSLLCKIDGERSIADLARECGFTLFEAGTVVRVLVEAGLVDVEEDVGPDGAPVDDDEDDDDSDIAPASSAPASSAPPRGAADAPAGSTGSYPRTAALAAAFALSSRDAPEPQPAETPADAAADIAAVESPSAPAWDTASSWDGAEAYEDEETSTLAQVSEALTKALGPRSEGASSFVDPFHVPDEIRLRPPPKAVASLPSPDEDQLRQDRIRHAAAAELAAAHAEAEAQRNASKRAPKAGHIAQVVDLEARREAARIETERRQTEQADAERRETERLEAARVAAEHAAQVEAERLEAERLEAERLAAEHAAQVEAERLEAARLAAEHAAQVEAERLEAERLAAEEAARVAAEEAARVEAERLEAERLAAEEAARVAAEEAARLEAERLEAERLAAEEAARVAAEEAARIEAERLEAERLEAERLAAEEAERLE
ncbi:MAG TPA: DUF4388 domain-containing protein, partial [Acidothermaceae bacterium]|nr:DUF4388 domain-containing protein [Acidothermaceae bacterium]